MNIRGLHYNSIGRRCCVFKPVPSTFLSTGLPRGWIMSLPEVQRGQTKCFDKFRPQFCLVFPWSFSQIVAKQFREPARRVLNKFVQTASRSLPCCACAETLPEWRLSRFALRPPPGVSVSAHPRALGDSSDGVSVSAGQLRQRGAACGAGNLLLRAGAAVRGEGAPRGGGAELDSVRCAAGWGRGLLLHPSPPSSPPLWSPAVPRSCTSKEATARRKCWAVSKWYWKTRCSSPKAGDRYQAHLDPLPSLPRKPSISFSPGGKCLLSLSLSCNEYSWKLAQFSSFVHSTDTYPALTHPLWYCSRLWG